MQEATIEKWYVQVGDHVTKGQELCEIVTEKISSVLECPAEGVFVELRVHEGEDAEPGDVLAVIEAST